MKILIPERLPNKSNTYEIHFNRDFYKAITPIIKRFFGQFGNSLRENTVRRKKLWWIAPSKLVKEVEEVIAWHCKTKLPDMDGELRLEIWISHRLDWDAVKAISDGIEKSGRIENDKQIKEGIVHKMPWNNVKFEFELTEI